MSREFAGFEIEVPFGPAAGAVNGASVELFERQMMQVINSPAGIALGGTFTFDGGRGNVYFGRTYFHNSRTGETVNSMGLPNISIREAQRIYPKLAQRAADMGKPLGASVASAQGENPVKALPNLVYRMFEAGAHFVEANYSCPNQIAGDGDREPVLCYNPDAVEEVRAAIIQQIGTDRYFGEKWAPAPVTSLEQHAAIQRLAGGLLKASGVYYVAGPNTLAGIQLFDENGKPALDVPGNAGGLSGPATRNMGRAYLKLLRDKLPPAIKIVSSSGVDTGAEVYHRTESQGADLATGVTVYFENEARGIDYGQTGVQIAEEYIEVLDQAA